MRHIRSFAMGIMLLFALGALAQQAGTSPSPQGGVPSVEQHLNLLAAKLDLTAGQRDKVRPILQEMHDGMQKLVDDPTQSYDERMAHMRPLHYKADKEIRVVLNSEQQKKLDQLEQESHLDFHGNADGATPEEPSSPQH